MAEANSNIGSASHLGENQVVRDAHFVYDYSRRRVPIPVISYMAVADAAGEVPPGESPSKKALDMLRDLVEPAVIAEEELNSETMEALLRDAIAEINAALCAEPKPGVASVGAMVSMTAVVADADRAYIGHLGSTRIYLLHNDRLYDLVPSAAAVQEPEPPVPPGEEAPTLFPIVEGTTESTVVPAAETAVAQAPDQAAATGAEAEASPGADDAQEAVPAESPQPEALVVERKGSFLGECAEANIGYNEVDVVPGDTIVLCTDGLWKTVSEAELVENLLAATNVQRSAGQLNRLAFSRDASDNATMVVWHYSSTGEQEEAAAAHTPKALKAKRARETRTRAAEVLLIALLSLVLVGIFAVGFALGWRITDTFRKPQKEAASKARRAAQAKEARQQMAAKSSQASQPAATAKFPRTETVSGQGVRMRASPNTSSDPVGLLRDGEQVTALEEVAGSDGTTWSKVKGAVTSSGQNKQAEGYVRNDFLKAQ